MEKLIKKYNDECNLTSKLANRLWKIGQIILLSILCTTKKFFNKFFDTVNIYYRFIFYLLVY